MQAHPHLFLQSCEVGDRHGRLKTCQNRRFRGMRQGKKKKKRNNGFVLLIFWRFQTFKKRILLSWPPSSHAAILEVLNSLKHRPIIPQYGHHDSTYLEGLLGNLGFFRNNRYVYQKSQVLLQMFKNLNCPECSRVLLLIGKTKGLFERSGAHYHT